jgi:diadenylate cyclase
MTVLKAIAVLIIALGLSNLLQLNVISFILSNVMELGILALVILFQPELRRILEQFGGNFSGWFSNRKMSRAEMETAIVQTVFACEAMSKTKTGALIVFERNVTLDDSLKTGTVLDAEPTAELLKNIFYPKAPLHDGAVIIRKGRVTGAGCMLPLTNNSNLSRDLGMRHRAGIGMSERSDAVVAIVSEETGAISVAVGGMLKRHLTPSTFEQILRNELISEEEQKHRILGFKGKKNEKQ